MASIPIKAVRTISGNQPVVRRLPEGATQDFLGGTPVQLTGGNIVEWDGATLTNGIEGFAYEAASDLAVAGVPETLHDPGGVPNQPSAVVIPQGAPLNDGKKGTEVAADDTVFYGQVGPDQTAASSDVGLKYGLTKDTDDYWFVDKDKTPTSGGGATNEAVVRVVGIDQYDDRGVYFQVLSAAQQLSA